MRSLVVYYSKSGNTRAVAEMIARALGGEVEEIVEVGVRRGGIFGYLRSGRGAMKKEKSRIEPSKKRPADLDLVVVGSPVWASNVAPAVRSYLTTTDLKGRAVGFVCTLGGVGGDPTLGSMRELAVGARVLGELRVLQGDLRKKEALETKVAEWAKDLAAKAATSP